MENIATELGSVAPVRRKEFRPRHNDAKFDASKKCGSDKCESDECETVQNVEKTDSDDAPETTGVESMAVDVTESRPIQTEHTTRSFKKRKAPSPLKPKQPSIPPPGRAQKPKPPPTPPPEALLSKNKTKKKKKKKDKSTTERVDPNLVCR